MVLFDDFRAWVEHSITDSQRFEHSLDVFKIGILLRKTYSLPSKLDFATMGHDVAKCLSLEEMMNYLKQSQVPSSWLPFKQIWHGAVGAIKIQKEFGLEDPEIFEAVYFHSTGKDNFCDLGIALYIADSFASWASYRPTLYIQGIDLLSRFSLKQVALWVVMLKLGFLFKSLHKMVPDGVVFYNYLVMELTSQEKEEILAFTF